MIEYTLWDVVFKDGENLLDDQSFSPCFDLYDKINL